MNLWEMPPRDFWSMLEAFGLQNRVPYRVQLVDIMIDQTW